MDKLVTYRQLIKTTLQAYERLLNASRLVAEDETEAHTLFDEANDRYMLFKTGWWAKERIQSVTLYVRLYEGKVWIEEDWTEEGIANQLTKAGVPKEEIVLAFHHPSMRPLTDFAVA